MENFPLQTGRDTHFRDEQLRAVPVMLGLVLDFFPHTGTEGSRRTWLAVVCGLEATLEGSTRRNTVTRRGTKIRRNMITRGNTITRRNTKTRGNAETRMTRKTNNPSTGQHHFSFGFSDFFDFPLLCFCLSFMSTPFRAAEKKFKDRSLPSDLSTVLDLACADPQRAYEVARGRWAGRFDALTCKPVGHHALAVESLPGALISPIHPQRL